MALPGCWYKHKQTGKVYRCLFKCPVSVGNGEDGAKWVSGVVYESLEGYRYARSEEAFTEAFEHYDKCGETL